MGHKTLFKFLLWPLTTYRSYFQAIYQLLSGAFLCYVNIWCGLNVLSTKFIQNPRPRGSSPLKIGSNAILLPTLTFTVLMVAFIRHCAIRKIYIPCLLAYNVSLSLWGGQLWRVYILPVDMQFAQNCTLIAPLVQKLCFDISLACVFLWTVSTAVSKFKHSEYFRTIPLFWFLWKKNGFSGMLQKKMWS